jgi:hypothetical protein
LPFETSAKKKRTIDESRLQLVTAVPYSPLFKDDKDLVLGDLSEVSGLMSCFDQSVSTISETLELFLEDYREQSNLALVAISALWLCLATMEGLVGSCPAALPNKYQVPSAWGSIGQLAIKLDRINKSSTSGHRFGKCCTRSGD